MPIKLSSFYCLQIAFECKYMVFPLIFHLAMEVKSFGGAICLLWLLSQNAEVIKYVLMSVKWIFQVAPYEGMKQL